MKRGFSRGETSGSASCPSELIKLHGANRYVRVAEVVCGRVCLREMTPLGYTPDDFTPASETPCATICKEARVAWGAGGVPPAPPLPELPQVD